MVRYREQAGISAGQARSTGTAIIYQCVSPDCPHPCLYSNLNVSTSTYRSTGFGMDRLKAWDDVSWEWRGFGPCLWGALPSVFPRGSELEGTRGVWPGGSCRESPYLGPQARGRQLWAGGQKNEKEKKK